MKKLTVLIVVIMVAGLLVGCWTTPNSEFSNIKIMCEGTDVTTEEIELVVETTKHS